MSFPNEAIGLNLRDGGNLSYSDSLLAATYTVSPFSYPLLLISSYPDTNRYNSYWSSDDLSVPEVLNWKDFASNTTFPVQNKTANGKDGLDITAADSLLAASYTTSPYLYPMLLTSAYPDTNRYDSYWDNDNASVPDIMNWKEYSGTGTFPIQNKTLTAKDGLDITAADALLAVSYTAAPYSFAMLPTAAYPDTNEYDSVWQSDNISLPTLITWKSFSFGTVVTLPATNISSTQATLNGLVPANSNTVFPLQSKTLTAKDGLDITEADAILQTSYSAAPYSFNFTTTWAKGPRYPYLITNILEAVNTPAVLEMAFLWGITPTPGTVAIAIGTFSKQVTGLVDGTTYYFQARIKDYSNNYYYAAVLFFVAAGASNKGLKRWDGAVWVSHSVKVWDGAAWVPHSIKTYNGGWV